MFLSGMPHPLPTNAAPAHTITVPCPAKDTPEAWRPANVVAASTRQQSGVRNGKCGGRRQPGLPADFFAPTSKTLAQKKEMRRRKNRPKKKKKKPKQQKKKPKQNKKHARNK
jgi:hypothetical protein